MAHGKHKHNSAVHKPVPKQGNSKVIVSNDSADDSPIQGHSSQSTRQDRAQMPGQSAVSPSPEPPLSNSELSKPSEPSEPSGPSELSEGESLDKIRDILFGQQVQTHDLRFEQLEQRLSEDYTRLRSDFLDRIEALENRLVDHIDRLTERLKEEETSRDEAMATLSRSTDQRFGEAARSLETSTTQLDEKLTSTHQDLTAEIKHQTLTLKDSLEQQIYDVLKDLETEKKERSHSTTAERVRLSTLLSTLSQQLSDDQ